MEAMFLACYSDYYLGQFMGIFVLLSQGQCYISARSTAQIANMCNPIILVKYVEEIACFHPDFLTSTLLVAIICHYKMMHKTSKMIETLAHGYSFESYPINTNMTGLK